MIRHSKMFTAFVGAVALALVAGWASVASAASLKPYKDDLFAYPHVVESYYNGDYVRVGYDKRRDIHKRDEVPERRVQSYYVSKKPNWSQSVQTVKVNGRPVKHYTVGETDRARMIVFYIHGQGGNRHQGVNDWTFGGNFNRIKNLMVRNGGLYISPDVRDFSSGGVQDIRGLLRHYGARSSGAPIFIACGSAGGALCWELAKDDIARSFMSGILLMGSRHDASILRSSVFASRRNWLPIYIGHGTNDSVFDWKEREKFFLKVRSSYPGYPIRFTLFETGSHGTPIRMTDWRLTLNWMLAYRR
ncbi:alpha/beta hydrolase [Coralliovum pocilloporae]|uniref:alpha/beta hydrolase n=1 Tax=Coralliovum pocilloporae TaxID=3066369 RepID=UPI003306EE5C